MHSSGSCLLTILDRVRGLVDEPSSKYSDEYIVNHLMMPEMTNVLSRIELTNACIILSEFTFTPALGDKYLVLPPNVGEIHSIQEMDSTGRLIRDYDPRSRNSRAGPGWMPEGNMITWKPQVGAGDMRGNVELTLWYKAEGDFMPHYALDGELEEVNNQVSRLYLTSNPVLGQVDRRANAYIGAILRILPEAPGVIEERIISAHAPEADRPYVDLRRPFDHIRGETGSTGSAWSGSDSSAETLTNVRYEIAPLGSQALYHAIAAATAMALCESKDVGQRKMQWIDRAYKRSLKTAADRLSNANMRKPKHYERKNFRNPEAIWSLGF